MALSGKLLADFTAFSTAVQKADVELRGMETGAGKVGASLNRMVDSFSGRKIITDATLAAEAVDRIGGTSKLTQAELQRLGSQATEAAAKLRAMGEDVPPKMQAIASAARDVGGELTAFGSAARSAGMSLTAALTVPIVGVAAAAIKLGIDATESRNLIEVSFGNMTKDADAWAANMSKSFGLNRFEVEKSAGVLFNMTTGMGLGRAAAFEMSTGVVKLAGDMSSFRNIPMEEALNKIRAGLVGESEPLKQIGILVDDATIKTYAYTHGIAAQGAELTAQQKVLARYGTILQQTANDQGDLARTIDSPANQLRIMKERVTEAATTLGLELLPTVQKVIGVMADLVPKIQGAVEWFGNLSEPVKVGGVVILGFVAAVGPMLVVLGQVAISLGGLIPLLSATSVQTAALGTSATVAGTAIGLMAKAVIAVPVAFGAWKLGEWIGETTGLTDTVEILAGRMMGLSDAEIKAGSDARKAGEEHKAIIPTMAQLAAEAKNAAAVMLAEAEAQAKTARETQANATAKKAAAAEAKKLAEAMVELNASGDGWRGTLAKINPLVTEAVAGYLAAGVSASALGTVYKLTDTEMKAITTSIKEQKSAIDDSVKAHEVWAKLQLKASQEAGQLWGEYESLRAAQSGTATDIAIANIERWKRDAIAKMKEAGTFNEQTYMAIEAVAKLKLEAIRVDWDALGENSRASLQQTADKARATYDEMIAKGGQFSSETIAKFWATAEAAQQAADSWDQSFTGAFISIGQSATEAAEKLKAAADKAKGVIESAGLSHPSTGLTVQVGNVNPFTGAGKASTDPRVWSYLEQGYSLGEAVSLAGGSPTNIGAAHGYWDQSGWHHGTRPIGHEFRRELGGPVSAGSSYMVGERGPELFTPRTSGTITPSGGGSWAPTIIVNTVAGDGPAIARLVKQALVDAARSEGRRF